MNIFGSRAKMQEILLLLFGAKRVVRQAYNKKEFYEVKYFCKQYNIHFEKADFHVSSGKEFTRTASSGLFFVYFSKKKDLALQAKQAEANLDHETLGLLLDYPPCCISHFSMNFPGLKVVDPKDPLLNMHRREEDWVLLSHFPCSSNCKKSLELGKKYISELDRFDPQYADRLLHELNIYKKSS